MARSFNQVILMGNLTRDPELRTTQTGQSVCSFGLALNRRYKAADGNWKDDTDYVDITAWGPMGENVAKFLTKGRPVLVNGRLQSSSWEQDGKKRTKVDVVAQDVTFLGGRGDDGQGSIAGGQTVSSSQSQGQTQQKDVVIDDISDEPIDLSEIPF